MKKVRKLLSWLMSLLMISGVMFANPIYVRADAKSVTISISCAQGVEAPTVYSAEYMVFDNAGTMIGAVNGNSDGTEASETIVVPDGGKIRLIVIPGEKDVFCNGSLANYYAEVQEIEFADIAENYAFQLQDKPGGGTGTPPSSKNIEFPGATITSGHAVYSVEGTNVEAVVSVDGSEVSIEQNGSHNELSIDASKISTVSISLTNFVADTMQAVLRDSTTYSQVLTVTDGVASFAGLNLPDMVNFSVERKNTQTNPDDQNNESSETVNLTVTWTGDFGEIKIGGTSIENLSAGTQTFTSANCEADGTIKVVIQAPYLENYNSIKLNGVESFTSASGDGKYTFYIPKTDTTLSIAVTKSVSTQHTIVWAYDNSMGEDAKVENGTVEVIGGVIENNPGHCVAENDATITIKLIPNYGYQVVGARINGDVDLTASSGTNEFTFAMPHTNVHFQGIFTKTDDIVANTTSSVSGASFAGDKVAANGGTAKMTLTDATAADTSQVTAEIDTSKDIQAVDITMDQLFYKNSASDVWSSNKTELAAAAQVNLTVTQDATGYAVLRTHNGVVEEIPANYNSETHTISFASNKYSTYTLVPLTEPNNNNNLGDNGSGESGNVAPETPAPETPAVEVTPLIESGEFGGVSINSWSDLETVILSVAEGSIQPRAKDELIKITISPSNAVVPSNIFEAVAKTEEPGIHLFAGSGTALSFVNDGKLSSQGSIDLSCTTTVNENGRTIKFNGSGKLSATSVLHSVAPVGVRRVTIYMTNASGEKKLIFETTPTDEGRFCFNITELGTYEIVYN